ncbi:hypothetical protein, partial [Acidisphaera sp. S103]|uniref:hypothetical protein n=1 Tax=Acidisphaera sp. S103 TaxID=1747223 RepID=UPI001C20C1CF
KPHGCTRSGDGGPANAAGSAVWDCAKAVGTAAAEPHNTSERTDTIFVNFVDITTPSDALPNMRYGLYWASGIGRAVEVRGMRLSIGRHGSKCQSNE